MTSRSPTSSGPPAAGYPAAAAYRDFHAREQFTGIRLWAITEPDVRRRPSRPTTRTPRRPRSTPTSRTSSTAVRARLRPRAPRARPARRLVVAAYDTELFGHWWHEGPAFLGKAIRALRAAGVTVTTVEKALAAGHVAGELELRRRVVGRGQGLLRSGTARGCGRSRTRTSGCSAAGSTWSAGERAAGRLQTRRPDLDQLLTSLFHALSSDWAFLVTRGQSVDYARRRAERHRGDFHQLAQLVEDGRA